MTKPKDIVYILHIDTPYFYDKYTRIFKTKESAQLAKDELVREYPSQYHDLSIFECPVEE